MAVMKAGQRAGGARKCGAETGILVRTALEGARKAIVASDKEVKEQPKASATAQPTPQQDTGGAKHPRAGDYINRYARPL